MCRINLNLNLNPPPKASKPLLPLDPQRSHFQPHPLPFNPQSLSEGSPVAGRAKAAGLLRRVAIRACRARA